MREANRDGPRRLLARAARPGRLELVITASLLLLAVVVFLSQRYMVETFERGRTWNAAALEMKARLTESRLLLDQRPSAERSVDVSRQVLQEIDRAQGLCQALRDGGRTSVGTVQRLPAGEARSAAATACAEIVTVRSAATTELSAGRGDSADPSYARAVRSSRAAARAADRHVQDRHLRARWFNGATTVALVLLLAAVVILVRRHHRRVRRLGERSESILTAAGEGIYGLDMDGRTTFVNPAAARMTGHEPEELLGRHLHEAIHHSRPDGTPYPVEECPVLASLADATVHHCDADVYWRKDGTSFPVDYTSTPLVEDGGVTGAVVVFRDISERRQLQDVLERQRNRLVEAESIGGFGSWELDIRANRFSWSDELCRIMGVEPGAHPTTVEDVAATTHPGDRAMMEDVMQTALERGGSFDWEHRILRGDGQVRVVHGLGRVVTGDDGAPVGMVGTTQDITEQREAQRAKDEFTSVVSHELRTPLTSIRGALGLLAGGLLTTSPAKAERMLQIALDNSDRLVLLINDILDIERIGSGVVEMHPQRCEAVDLIERAMQGVEQIAAAAQVVLTVEAEPITLWADCDRVLQTLTNLLSNAIKFSPAGATVRVAAADRGDEVLFEVADEGRGIPAHKLDSIFERFQQVDSSDSREKGGTGLGLAICRSIVEQHGGRIWAESVEGSGSTFRFTLPAASSQQAALSAAEDAARPRILVCDDDAGVREVVATMLEQRGYQVITAGSGREAIERALSERPSAILLDILMPGLSGWETALELARRPETRDVPVVILSVMSPADGAPAPVAVADWIEKPLDAQTLFGALDRALAREPTTERERTIERVLIVEDDEDLAAVLVELFERHGLQALHAANGVDAVELSRDLKPDLLILDVGLPDGDGFWVSDWLRQHEPLRNVPIVVYTAHDLDAAQRARLDNGHTHFASKGAVTLEQFERDVMQIVQAVAPIAEPAEDAR